MGPWIDDQTTLSFVAPEILDQEERIAQQRRLISQLVMSGHRARADDASRSLRDMCDALETMRRDERAAKIDLREASFHPVS
jgi:hypothetical protein